MRTNTNRPRLVDQITLLIRVLSIITLPNFGQRESSEMIDATAFGTNTQLGRNFGVARILLSRSF